MTSRNPSKQQEQDPPVSCPWPAIGDLVDPDASAAAMKRKFAEMEARHDDA